MTIRQQHRMLESAFGHLLPPAPKSLGTLAHEMLLAKAILMEASGSGWDAANASEFDATQAFKDALVAKTGMSLEVWERVGLVL